MLVTVVLVQVVIVNLRPTLEEAVVFGGFDRRKLRNKGEKGYCMINPFNLID